MPKISLLSLSEQVRNRPVEGGLPLLTLANTICLHRCAIVKLSVALTSQNLFGRTVFSELRLTENCSYLCLVSSLLGCGLCLTLPLANTVSDACPTSGKLYTRDTLSMSVSDTLPPSKLISAHVFSKKSMPSRPAASVGSGHTRNGCIYCRPSNVKKQTAVLLCQGFSQSHHMVLLR